MGRGYGYEGTPYGSCSAFYRNFGGCRELLEVMGIFFSGRQKNLARIAMLGLHGFDVLESKNAQEERLITANHAPPTN